ncbi:hypothetical protein Rleg2_1164 [Rhizobium leguminosarum bv. trifolii WSM2304]|uniref:Relaxase/mobilization nuclease domain-containing protein n=1 Tax=Rhizobium leguminosarum bv. trifolii (strain WSM2304) TaxID=395492 RepID=A0ABF7QK79_RHILW|nr:hypothetical protein [Rhizobium leguminosarum]ACI54458.1 hypothetical protein Rleg2_1164 [Rhizobium leguminosarum bv. trifolii WSM2304]
MAATLPVFLKHTFIGKASQQEPHTARAHSRYIQRKSETHSVRVYLMPEDYRARQRWWYDHENGLRANGRVTDKFTISVPHAVSLQHAEDVAFNFGLWLGQGRCPFELTTQGWNSRNHHIHFMFVDRDCETGKRVFGTTERNSTRLIKLEWERVANQMFEQLGYDVRIKVHDGLSLEADNDNAQEPAQEPLDEGHDVDDLPDMPEVIPEPEDAGDGDDDVAFVTSDLVGVDPVESIKFIHDVRADLEFLHRSQAKLQEATERHAWLLERRNQLAAEAGQYYEESLPKLMNAQNAQERLAGYQRDDGSLKGRSFGLFGYTLFKTKERKIAEQVQIEAHNLKLEANQVEYTRRSYDRQIDELAQQVSRAEEAAHAHKGELLRLYGNEEDIQLAEAAMRNGIELAASDVTLEQATEAYENEAITVDEYRTFLLEAGYDAEVQLLDESLSEDGGMSL